EGGYDVDAGSHPDDNWICVGLLNGFNLNTPENFGAKPYSESDCLNAINMAIKTGFIELTPGCTYFVSDEVVIPSYLVM
ncbi:hypothetical protein OFN37_39025, partial [Escherichia coli]|nr:hypothetical protein [Escherichia coli]